MNEHRFGWVAIVGPPNAGKSTLLNTILGQKIAIVSPKPQTTRNQISGILTREDAQVVFLDTPGIHALRGRMNRFLLESARQAIRSADVILALADSALYAKKPSLLHREMAPLARSLEEAGRPLLLAVNKVDLVKDKENLLPVMAALGETWPGAEIFPISAAKNQGVDKLLSRIVSLLPPAPPMFPEDQISTAPLRFMAGEIVREKLFLSLRQELPYQTAVQIDDWSEEPERGLTRIAATIFVGRDAHKAMVIGKAGSNLKKIGQAARLEIEDLTQTQVALTLWVKVRENWTENEPFLRSLGLGE